jgi:mRNA interferase RelE/StbE
MEIIYTSGFQKDIENISIATLKKQLLITIEEIKKAESLIEIRQVKKMKGAKSAYRIRIGDYRLGFFLTGRTITLARFVHRKDIYKQFP